MIYAGSVEDVFSHLLRHTLKFLSGSKEGTTFSTVPSISGVTGSPSGARVSWRGKTCSCPRRKALIQAEVLGFGYYFDPFGSTSIIPEARGSGRHPQRPGDAQVGPEELIISAPTPIPQPADKIETETIKEVFGQHAYKIRRFYQVHDRRMLQPPGAGGCRVRGRHQRISSLRRSIIRKKTRTATWIMSQ